MVTLPCTILFYSHAKVVGLMGVSDERTESLLRPATLSAVSAERSALLLHFALGPNICSHGEPRVFSPHRR